MIVALSTAIGCAAPRSGWQRPVYVGMLSAEAGAALAVPVHFASCATASAHAGLTKKPTCPVAPPVLAFLLGAAATSLELTLAEDDEPSTLEWAGVSTAFALLGGLVLHGLFAEEGTRAPPPVRAPRPPRPTTEPRLARFDDLDAARAFVVAVSGSDRGRCQATPARLAELLAGARAAGRTVLVAAPADVTLLDAEAMRRLAPCVPHPTPEGPVFVEFDLDVGAPEAQVRTRTR